jgi:predicted nucleic acid-binding protein
METSLGTITKAIAGAKRIFLDTAIVIYYVEQHPTYAPLLNPLFELDDIEVDFVLSPITLAEALIVPIRLNDWDAYHKLADFMLNAPRTAFILIGSEAAKLAAEFRARYNLALTDAFQIAVAITAGCDAFLTNDKGLRRVSELSVLVLDDLCMSEANGC